MLSKNFNSILKFQVLRSMRNELDGLKREVRMRQGSEDQMKQVNMAVRLISFYFLRDNLPITVFNLKDWKRTFKD